MNPLATGTVLTERHEAYSLRRQRLALAAGPALTPDLTWSVFWDQVFRTLRSCGYRRSTCRQYRHVLRALRAFGIRRPSDITAARADSYITRLATSGASWSWIGMNIAVLRTVFDRLCGLSVTAGMVTPKRGYRLPEILNENEAVSLVTAAGTVRDQLLLGLLYGCGLTAGEVCALRWRDVLDDGDRLHIAATTRYLDRVLTVPEPFRELLRAGAETCEPDDHIFRGRRKGTALGVRTVRHILRNACRRAGIGRPVCVTTLRYSYAVRRIENGLNLRELQQELGHASVRTTERYRHCLAPKVENHPFSKVRKLQAHSSQPSPLQVSGLIPQPSRTLQVSGLIPQPSRTPPLAGLDTIRLHALRLPFAPGNGDSRAAAFLRLLTNRLFSSIVRLRRPRSP